MLYSYLLMCWKKTTICNSDGEAVSEQWDAFVEATPMATVSHLYGWRKVVTNSYGHKTFYLTALRAGEIVGILPLVHIKSRLFDNILVSMPFQDYGGIIAQDEDSFRQLLEHALRIKKENGAQSLELRDRRQLFLSPGCPYGDKATLVLDISPGEEKIWMSFSPKVRNQVRKAQKLGLVTQIGGVELLEEFYRPFSVNMRDLGSPVHHLKFLSQIFSVFGDNVRIVLVRDGLKTVGGLIAFFFKNTVIVPWASCYRQYFPKCPNNVLYWNTIQYACERGCTIFDFGRSSMGSGTYNFKTQWGAQPELLHWQIFNQGSSLSQSENSGLQMASAVWKHIPLVIANIAGPRLRGFIKN
jgi:FemAB-related protein (PEP-CTERM system-associated)